MNQASIKALYKQSEKENIVFLRAYLKNGFAQLKSDFALNPNTTRLFKQHCKLIDELLHAVWLQSKVDDSSCLIAVGGYGRGELYPYSDVDILILVPENKQSTGLETEFGFYNQAIEGLVGKLWDLGLSVGHSVRSLSECMVEAKKDITVQTNLLESRFIAGNSLLYQSFLTNIHSHLDVRSFYTAKLKEQDNRHAKFNDTAYNLEPNIKESPGGLRDLHMIIWLARGLEVSNLSPERNDIEEKIKAKPKHTSLNIWTLLNNKHIISTLEVRQIKHHEKNLQLLRIRLHFLSGRREDRLLFDFQNEMAAILGYVNTPNKRASEQLMQSYYRSVRFISLMNEIILKSLQKMVSANPPVVQSINAHFEAHDHLLEAKSAGLLQQHPSSILEAFLVLQQHPELTGMGASLLRNLQRVKNLVNQDFRQNTKNKKLFIEIMSYPNGVNHALRAMNRYGILGNYIPAFGKIIGQMQHDLFHVYTVDQHILNVLANLRRFTKPDHQHEFPLCSQLFATFDAPHLLYLAAIFHDIAKGRGGDHSILGTVDAIKFCKLHGLPKADCQLVGWLVEAHLKMSSTAQKSDLSDPNVVESFARFVENERKLIALYLLTVADIRGTSPVVWNAWKARLLESLFYATRRRLAQQLTHETNDTKQNINTEQTVAARKAMATEKLNKLGLSPHSYQDLWLEFGVNYFIRHESEEIAWHSRLLTPHLNVTKPIVRARLSPSGDGIQVMIYTKDRDDIFARICNFFDRMGYDIVEAKIYTTNHSYALNTFIILDQSGKSVSYSGLLKFIEIELTQKLDENKALETPLQGRISRQVKHMPIQTQVTITEAEHNNHKLEIVANDRTGLLATLAHQFLIHEIDLHNAKINTLGNRAEDSFLISAKKGAKLEIEQIKMLKQILAGAI